MNLIEPRRMGQEDFEKLRTDVRQVFKVISVANDKEKTKELLMQNPEYQEMDREAAELVNTLVDVKIKIKIKEGGTVDMGNAWKEQWEDGRQAGRLEGKLEGERKGRREGKLQIAEKMLRRGRMTLEEISEDTGLTLEEVEELEKTICSGV